MASRKEYEVFFALNAALNGNFQGTFSKAQLEFARLGKEVQNLQKLQANVSSYQKQEQAIASTTQRLTNLQQQEALLVQQIEAARNAENQDAVAIAALEREKLKLEQRINDTTASLERQNQRLDTTGAKLKEAGVDTGNLTSESQRLTTQLEELSKQQEEAAKGAQTFGEKAADGFSAAGSALAAAGIGSALRETVGYLADCSRAAMEHESVMAGVRRTVGGSEEQIAALGAEFRELSTDIPITTTELGGIAETAGQLGIAQSAVGEFTEVMAQLSTTTDLTADSASTMLAQFANITGTTDYQRLGSVVAELGDATATTASKVVEMGQGLAAAAKQAGMSERDTLAVSAAVGSLGIEAQAGSTAMSTLISSLNKAVETGKGLKEFAAVSNMSAAEFKTAWGQNAVGAMDAFIQGLNDTERNGRSAVVILDELGITNVRQTKAILGLASAGDLLSGTIAQANRAWDENTALQEKAGIMYRTTQSQLVMTQNAYSNLKAAIGESFTPEVQKALAVGREMMETAEDFVQENPEVVKAVAAFTTVAFGAATAIAAVNAAGKAWKALDMAAAFTSVPGMAVMAIGTVTALVVASAQLAGAWEQGTEDLKELTAAHREALEGYESAAAGIDSEANHTLGLLNSLRALSGQSEKTAADQAQIAELCQQLNAAVPDLSLSYDAQADSVTGLTGSLDDYIERLYQAQRQEKDVGRLVELRGSLEDTRTALEETRAKVEELEAARDRLAREGSDVFGVEQELSVYKARTAELTALLGEEEAEYARLTETVNGYSEAQESAADTGGKLSAILDGAKAELELLTAAYNEAYEAAFSSISGQYSLWDEAAKIVATEAGSINAALDSQISYWERYNANLQVLGERSAGIEGLSDMIATFADGSKDSVNAIAGMASASDADLRAMVSKWTELQEQQAETSESLAELAAGVPEKMEELVGAIEDGVEGMSMPEQAGESARETIQAFIDEANSMLPVVQRAYALLGKTAANSLGIHDVSTRTYDPAYIPQNAFASGTSNAPPGWAWVGEKGPELIHMQGGETVLPAEISREFAILTAHSNKLAAYAGGTDNAAEAVRLLEISNAAYSTYSEAAYNNAAYNSFGKNGNTFYAGTSTDAVPAYDAIPSPSGGGSTAPITVEVHIHMEGTVSPDTAASIRDYVESSDFKERVRDAVAEAQEDAARMAMI